MGLFVLAGAVLTRRFFMPAAPRARLLAAIGAALFVGGILANVAATLYDLLDEVPPEQLWAFLTDTTSGRQSLAAGVAAVTLAAIEIVRLPALPDRAVLSAAILVLLGAVALPTHAGAMALAEVDATVWPLIAQVVHVAAVLSWGGPLVVLAWNPLPDRDAWIAAVRRFSRWAAIAAGAFVASGLFLSVAHVGRLSDLVGTAYGRYLDLKIVAVAVVLALAAHLRQHVLAPRRATRLRLEMRLETVLLLVVVAFTASLASAEPPHGHRPAAAVTR